MEYTITLNEQYKSYEVAFTGKPDKATRDSLKALKFRWNPTKSIWYGFSEKDALVAALSGGTVEDNKIAPIETGGSYSDGYMGARRWDGIHSHEKFELKDVNKYLKKLCKQNYGVDIKTRYKSYSGGQSTDIYICLNESSFTPTENMLKLFHSNDRSYTGSEIRNLIGKGAFGNPDILDKYEWFTRHNNTPSDERDRVITEWYETKFKFQDSNYPIMYISHKSPELYLLKENYRNAAESILSTLESYNYDDSNGMVDYFNTNFYYSVYLQFLQRNSD